MAYNNKQVKGFDYDVLRGKWMVDDESEQPAPLRNIGKDAK